MKKIISILLAAVMVMALLAGCGSKNKDNTNDNNTSNNNQTTELSGVRGHQRLHLHGQGHRRPAGAVHDGSQERHRHL